MNWEALSALGEIAGAMAVIVTLVYLSVQIRQNTKASRVAAVQAGSGLFLSAQGRHHAR